MKLNFKFSELINSKTARTRGINNVPKTVEQLDNLWLLITECLQPIRDMVGKPVIVTSGYRCPALNKAVGGVINSHHVLGCAADIKVKGLSPTRLALMISKSSIQYTQLIIEYNSWVHISYVKDNLKRQTPFIID